MNKLTEENKKRISRIQTCQKKVSKRKRTCCYPDCSEKAINSHILQQNGILNKISKDSHLWHIGIDFLQSEIFKPERKGIKTIFSFPGFCKTHDPELFQPIENSELNFDSYRHCILLTIRTFYNELYRKIKMNELYNCLLIGEENMAKIENLKQQVKGSQYAINDFRKLETPFWQDVLNSTEQMSFRIKKIPKIEIVLSSFFDYETTDEISILETLGISEQVELSPIFVTTFPQKDKSIFIIGYFNRDEKMVKGYVNSIFKEKGNRFLRRLSNLLLLQCENWVCSEKFYLRRIKDKEIEFNKMIRYGFECGNERRNPKVNMFGNNFKSEVSQLERNGR